MKTRAIASWLGLGHSYDMDVLAIVKAVTDRRWQLSLPADLA